MSQLCYNFLMRKITNPALIQNYIQQHDFYALFDSDVSGCVELLYYEPKEYLIRDGEISPYLLFLVDGECRFFTISNDGTYISFGAAKEFEVFGEVSSLWGLEPANNVQAVKPTYCLGFQLSQHREMLLNDNRFLRYLCQIISTRVITSNEALKSYLSVKAENRLANYITQHTDNDIFSSSLGRCSEAIGISYRHLLRLLNDFCKREILKKENRRYHVINPEMLLDLTTDEFFTM